MARYSVITLKRDATCADCGRQLKAGEEARWYPDIRKVYCKEGHGNGGAPVSRERITQGLQLEGLREVLQQILDATREHNRLLREAIEVMRAGRSENAPAADEDVPF